MLWLHYLYYRSDILPALPSGHQTWQWTIPELNGGSWLGQSPISMVHFPASHVWWYQRVHRGFLRWNPIIFPFPYGFPMVFLWFPYAIWRTGSTEHLQWVHLHGPHTIGWWPSCDVATRSERKPVGNPWEIHWQRCWSKTPMGEKKQIHDIYALVNLLISTRTVVHVIKMRSWGL